MTCIIGVATSSASILAVDTRLNVTFKGGQKGHQDEEKLTITDPNGEDIVIGERFRKIRAINAAWISGAGAFPLIHHGLIEAEKVGCANVQELHKRLRVVYDREAAKTFEQFPEMWEQIGKTTMVCTCVVDGKFELYALPMSGGSAAQAGYIFTAPSDLAPSMRQQLQARLESELETPGDMSGVLQQVRLVADVLHQVHGASALVSDRLEVGLWLNDGKRAIRLYLQKRNGDITGGSDQQLLAAFENF